MKTRTKCDKKYERIIELLQDNITNVQKALQDKDKEIEELKKMLSDVEDAVYAVTVEEVYFEGGDRWEYMISEEDFKNIKKYFL